MDDSLTPTGAILQGSDDGQIPDWVSDKTVADELHQQLDKDTPLFVINGSNYQKYQAHLTAGQVALFELYPETFEMPIYQSKRLHHIPQWLEEATRKNQKDAELIDDGNGITNVWPGVPFPTPENALEILWNHLIAWRSISAKGTFVEATIHPEQRHYLIKTEVEIAMPYYQPDRVPVTDNIILTYYLTRITSPARIAGGATLVHDSMNPKMGQRQSWIYNVSQRRVRRLPFLGYDTPNMNSDDIRVVDEVNLFNGSPDRYNWKSNGRKTLYIPYNSKVLAQSTSDIESLLTPYHLNTAPTRYELHRVWELEATLKEKQHHIYARRKLYLDEDSWMALIAEQYDQSDALWRVSLSHTQYMPDMPGVMKVADVFHDLNSKSYYVQSLIEDNGRWIEFSNKLPEKSHFNPVSLKRRSTR
ncbi:hypothetical protein GCM10007876_12130 [Litoribrevibacter albus]|uniref:DUF1329 domain-containing protein n=2 Tax=Litoribrevibacter albus TaxID=1473156 RepID=A0AA37W733_9GAMM|nr:hypothetical protein GCM10007876_12130 [Litoribrevibacter albus]